jgi:hypothetical protein
LSTSSFYFQEDELNMMTTVRLGSLVVKWLSLLTLNQASPVRIWAREEELLLSCRNDVAKSHDVIQLLLNTRCTIVVHIWYSEY